MLRTISINILAVGTAAFAALSSAQPGTGAVQVRLTPGEYRDLQTIEDRGGAPGAPPLESRMLNGDPSKLGLYTILLKIPPHTRIAAHRHPDERVGTVVEGTLHYGYGEKFDENALKELPPGSFYTEPAGVAHFSRTGDDGAVVQITGVGPTGTDYTDPARQRFDSDR